MTDAEVIEEYERRRLVNRNKLRAQLVIYISQSGVPVEDVVVILDLLRIEALRMIEGSDDR